MAFQDEIWLVEAIGPDPTSPGLLRVEGSVTASLRSVAIGQRRQGSGSPRARVDVYEALDGHLPCVVTAGACGPASGCGSTRRRASAWLARSATRCRGFAPPVRSRSLASSCARPGRSTCTPWRGRSCSISAPGACVRQRFMTARIWRRAILHVWVCEVSGGPGRFLPPRASYATGLVRGLLCTPCNSSAEPAGIRTQGGQKLACSVGGSAPERGAPGAWV